MNDYEVLKALKQVGEFEGYRQHLIGIMKRAQKIANKNKALKKIKEVRNLKPPKPPDDSQAVMAWQQDEVMEDQGEKLEQLLETSKDAPKLPMFSEENPMSWIFQVEHWFSVNEVPEMEKMAIVAVCLEGRVVNSFQWKEMRKPLISWSEFKSELIQSFQDSRMGNGYKIIMALKLDGSGTDYSVRFELLLAPWEDADMLIGAFKNGLQDDIRVNLRFTKAHNLIDIMDVAHKLEERNQVIAKCKKEKKAQSYKEEKKVQAYKEKKKAQSLKHSFGLKWMRNRFNFNKVSNLMDPTRGVTSYNTNKSLDLKGGGETINSIITQTTSSTTTTSLATPNKTCNYWTEEEVAKKSELGLCYR